MATVRLTAGCKINLFLHIGERRADGYHEIDTLFYPLPRPYDVLTVRDRPGEGLDFSCSDPAISGPDNLVVRAWTAFADASGFAPGLTAHLDKRCPYGAGLGSASADAAAMLRFLNARAGERRLSPDDLNTLAAGLGADVPFFLQDQPCLAGGIGERLTPVARDFTGWRLVLVCPDIAVSTAWAYRAWDALRAREGKSPERALTSGLFQTTGPFSGARFAIANDFEQVVFPEYPELRRIKERLLALGAQAAALSGSGSSLFGLFRGPARARAAREALAGPGRKVLSMTL